MANFNTEVDIKPTYNTRITHKPNVSIVRFGDGYQQRLTQGLNTNPVTANLVFEISQSESDSAIAFLNARITNNESFDFTLPSETTSRKFICTSYPRTIPFLNRVRLTCTFQEVFEP